MAANGVLGVGSFLQDCGSDCTQSGSINPGVYFECAAKSCQVAVESLNDQVQNPVGMFATDNNGVILELPSAPGMPVNFIVSNADTLFSNPGDFVFPTLAGPNPGTFDWGFPFFFGRNVYTAIESRNTPAGQGPYWAF